MTTRPYHTPEQERAWLAVESTIEAWAAADWAAREADKRGDDEHYPALLREALRAERELDGAWAHYHRI